MDFERLLNNVPLNKTVANIAAMKHKGNIPSNLFNRIVLLAAIPFKFKEESQLTQKRRNAFLALNEITRKSSDFITKDNYEQVLKVAFMHAAHGLEAEEIGLRVIEAMCHLEDIDRSDYQKVFDLLNSKMVKKFPIWGAYSQPQKTVTMARMLKVYAKAEFAPHI